METDDSLVRMASIMSGSWVAQDTTPSDPTQGQRDLYTQLVISSLLGISAFLSFCVSCDLTLSWGVISSTDSR